MNCDTLLRIYAYLSKREWVRTQEVVQVEYNPATGMRNLHQLEQKGYIVHRDAEPPRNRYMWRTL